SVLAAGKNRNKYFHGNKLSGHPVDDVQLLSRKIDEHLLSGYVVKFHGTIFLRVFAAVMLKELGITVWIPGLLHVLLVVVQKCETGVVTGLFDPFKIQHKLVMPSRVNSRMGGKQLG